jgi:GT2 family glycosyltransferase/glycosyltransferase involved in cell wall biosynthesis
MTGLAADYPVTAEDVPAVYMLMLARRPETGSVSLDNVGRTLRDIIAMFIHSAEFAMLADDAVKFGVLAHTQRLKSRDYEVAAKFVARATETPRPDIESWWVALHLMFGLAFVKPDLAERDVGPFLDLVASRASGDAGQFIKALPFFAVDGEWLARASGKARLALSSGTYRDAGAFFLANELVQDKPLLAAFSEGLDHAYRPLRGQDRPTIADVLTALLRGARSGRVTHWLFSALSYRDILLWQDDAATDPDRRAIAEPDLYLDFLTHGDARGYSPHPLFCHHAYGKLNPGLAFRCGTNFLDYITHGCFSDAATSAVFDAGFYLASNPSARHALLNGTHVAALHHFVTFGVFHDLPFSPDFDLPHYIRCSPDIEGALQTGAIPSATWHFVYRGLAEGRAPNPYFNPRYYRERHPQVPREMRALGIRSEIEHYLLLGRDRGYRAEHPLVADPPAMDAAKAIFQRRALRSLGNLRRGPLDFRAFASAGTRISLVVPVCNEIEFTSRIVQCAFFAASYLLQTAGVGCELIVVDNGSTDGTASLLGTCPGIRIVSFLSQIGFPRAVNAGVRASAGDLIVVANNDVAFMPDAFAKIWHRLNADDSIGVLGGLTILPNETVQEAGSFVDCNGSVVGLGRLENPWDQYFQGVHDADYCTGSFIAFRRTDFDALGGLDEAFSPGYYEETDFSFRMAAKLGKRSAIDADIQITHFEHGSFGKGRPPTTAYAIIKQNQALFASKHRDALARRPSPARLVTDQGARPAVIGRTRFLVIEDLMPDTRLGSGFGRASQLLASLTRHKVAYDLLVLGANAVVTEFSDNLVTVYRGWMPGQEPETILNRHAAKYSHVLVCRTHNLARFAHQLERLRDLHGFTIICDTEALGVLRALETRRLAGEIVTDQQRIGAIRLDLGAEVRVSQWIAVSPHERAQIEAAGFHPVRVVGHHFAPPAPTNSRPWRARGRVIAVGAMHEAGSPNHDGLMWFMERIYPRCAAVFDELKLTIVGFWQPDIRSGFAAKYGALDIDFAGVVTDAELTALYDESRIALAPTRFAAGLASKVVEAMISGVPVVMTDLLATQMTGFADTGTTGLAVGQRSDDGASFARWVMRLASDEAVWNRVREKQYDVAMPLGGADAFESGVRSVLAQAGIDT